MSDNPPETAPLGVNITVHATDGRAMRAFPDCKRFFSLGTPRFIGLPEGWHARSWEPQDRENGSGGWFDLKPQQTA